MNESRVAGPRSHDDAPVAKRVAGRKRRAEYDGACRLCGLFVCLHGIEASGQPAGGHGSSRDRGAVQG